MKKTWFIHLLLVIVTVTAVFAQEFPDDEVNYYDYVPDFTYDQIGERLESIGGEIPLNYNDRVKAFIDYFTIRNRDYTRGILAKKDIYFPIFEEYLKKYDLPDELKYLSIIESGLNPNALSRVGAGGLWQFMPSTGRIFGLQSDWYIDDRMDPYASTEAACKYLKSLHKQFGDWELALAAYNTGPGNVRRAIRRSGYKKSFWEIYRYLPRETRSYVPQFVAMIYSINYAEEHNLWMPENHMPAYDTVMVSDYFHMETFANLLNVCLDDMIALNPQVKRGAIPEGRKDFALRLPAELKPMVLENRLAYYDSASKVGKMELEHLARNLPGSTYGRERQVYRVRGGDVLGKIAGNYGVRVVDLKKWNNLSSSMIRVGQRLNIWVLPQYSSKTKDQYIVQNLPQTAKANNGYYKVQYGDTLWEISRKYQDVSIDKIKSLNNLSNNSIQVGQVLRISEQ
ncbi:MAG: transglycosylase SLT domain-containing protein [Cyclobacteriaceae bacterium]